jgi:uncharacterized protein (TIGR00645 family)
MHWQSKLGRVPQAIVFEGRWLLYPLMIVLLIALAIYGGKFVAEDYALVASGFHIDAEQLMILLLGLVDMFMVANLTVMIIQGGYQIFIQRFHRADLARMPRWLDRVDTQILKVKMAKSIAGITLIRVLKDFVNLQNTSWDIVLHRMYIHGLCLLSMLVFAAVWRLLQQEA